MTYKAFSGQQTFHDFTILGLLFVKFAVGYNLYQIPICAGDLDKGP